jgi:hypothetical protein
MSKNTVTVVADDNGNVIHQSKNPEIGYVKVTQDAVIYSANGWVQRKMRSALILGHIEDLKELKFKSNQTLPGRIVIKESTEPFSVENPDYHLKVAGNTGIICCTIDGEPIYRTTFYDVTGEQEDVFVPHANGDAIRKYNLENDGATKMVSNEFTIKQEVEQQEEEEVDEELEEVMVNETEMDDTFEL